MGELWASGETASVTAGQRPWEHSRETPQAYASPRFREEQFGYPARYGPRLELLEMPFPVLDFEIDFQTLTFDTEYDRAKVPPYNGNDPPPAPGSLKTLLFPPLLNNVENKGTQGVRARYGAELPPVISIVRYPGRPVISVPKTWENQTEGSDNYTSSGSQKAFRTCRAPKACWSIASAHSNFSGKDPPG